MADILKSNKKRGLGNEPFPPKVKKKKNLHYKEKDYVRVIVQNINKIFHDVSTVETEVYCHEKSIFDFKVKNSTHDFFCKVYGVPRVDIKVTHNNGSISLIEVKKESNVSDIGKGLFQLLNYFIRLKTGNEKISLYLVSETIPWEAQEIVDRWKLPIKLIEIKVGNPKKGDLVLYEQ